MKISGRRYWVLAFACIALVATSPIFAKDWSPEQKAALNAFNNFIAAGRQGNFQEMKSYWHPKYIAWDYAQELPMNYDVFVKGEEEFFKNYKFKKLEFDPLEIQVEGNLAIIHLNYDMVVSDATGKGTSSSGRWTTIMLKQDKRWLIMSAVWKEK